MEDATDVIFVLYFIGAITTGVALIAALVGLREVWRYSIITCLILSLVSHPQVLPEAQDSVANALARVFLSSPCFIHYDHRHR